MSFAAALASRRRCTSRSRTSPSSSKEAMGVPDLEFLMLDEWMGGRRFSVVRLQGYAEKAQANSDRKVAVRLKRVQARFPAQRS